MQFTLEEIERAEKIIEDLESVRNLVQHRNQNIQNNHQGQNDKQ
jgi:hypothetical protein